MRKTTLRLSESLWEALNEEAEREGITVAQYMREAALVRISYERARRGDRTWERLLSAVERRAR